MKTLSYFVQNIIQCFREHKLRRIFNYPGALCQLPQFVLVRRMRVSAIVPESQFEIRFVDHERANCSYGQRRSSLALPFHASANRGDGDSS